MCVYIYIYIYIYVCVYIYIYIYKVNYFAKTKCIFNYPFILPYSTLWRTKECEVLLVAHPRFDLPKKKKKIKKENEKNCWPDRSEHPRGQPWRIREGQHEECGCRSVSAEKLKVNLQLGWVECKNRLLSSLSAEPMMVSKRLATLRVLDPNAILTFFMPIFYSSSSSFFFFSIFLWKKGSIPRRKWCSSELSEIWLYSLNDSNFGLLFFCKEGFGIIYPTKVDMPPPPPPINKETKEI